MKRLRSFWKHEQLSLRLQHRCPGPEEEEHEQNDAPRRQNTPHPRRLARTYISLSDEEAPAAEERPRPLKDPLAAGQDAAPHAGFRRVADSRCASAADDGGWPADSCLDRGHPNSAGAGAGAVELRDCCRSDGRFLLRSLFLKSECSNMLLSM